MGVIEEYDDNEEIVEESSVILFVYFYMEKSGGILFVLYMLEFVNLDNDDVFGLINCVCSEDVMFDKDLRVKYALCSGSVMFLMMVWKVGMVWELGYLCLFEDLMWENWEKC